MRREVAESLGVIECKGQRGGGVVETVKLDSAMRVAGFRKGLDDRDRIRRRAETHVPDYERPARFPRPLDEALLADMEPDGFRHRADDGMEGLAKLPRAQTARAGLDGYEFKTSAIFS